MCVLTSSVFCVDLGRSWGGGQGEGARACGLTACSLSWAVSATGRFAFPLREPPLANLNKERIYWHNVEKFTEPKTAEIQASKRAQSEWLSDLAANPPPPRPLPEAGFSGCPTGINPPKRLPFFHRAAGDWKPRERARGWPGPRVGGRHGPPGSPRRQRQSPGCCSKPICSLSAGGGGALSRQKQ